MIGQLPGSPTCPHCRGRRSTYHRHPLTGRYSLELPTPEHESTSAETLPCGCIIDTVGDAFVMQPCRPDCTYYRYAMAQAHRQGMPVRTIVDPTLT